MKMKIVEPTALSEIPLQSYQKWMKVAENTDDEELLAHKFVQIFLGLKLSDAVNVRFKDINRFMESISKVLKTKPVFKKTFKFNGIKFGFIPDLENISWGEYIDIEQNLTSWENYHIALSVMYRPITKEYKDTYEIQEYTADPAFHDLFKMIGLDVALSASVFFWNLERELLQSTLLSLKNQEEMMILEQMTLAKDHNLTSNGDGITAFTNYLMEIYSNSMKLSDYLFINALPCYPMKLKGIE